jgi:PAS domain S-box-containing protein
MEDKQQSSEQKFAILRQHAEDLISHHAQEGRQAAPVDIRNLVHELEVHQIELEMQNEELVQAQVELEKSRDRFEDLYDFAPVGYVTLNEKGIILEANLTAGSLLGIERKKLVRQQLANFVFREDQDAFYFFRKSVFKSQTQVAGEVRLIRGGQGGEPISILLEGITTPDAGGELICHLSIRDISKQKAAEQALRENQANLQALLEFNTGIVWSVDRQYRLIAGNDGMRKNYLAVLGREIQPGESTLVERLPDVYTEWRGYYDRALAGETFKIESPTRAQPEVRYLEYTFRPVRTSEGLISSVIVSGRDITERKQTQEALEQSENRFGRAFFDAPVPLNVVRARDGKFIEVNERFIELFGYNREELIGHTSVDLSFYASDAARTKMNDLLREEGCVRDLEIATPTKSGVLLCVLVSAVPVVMNGEECILGTLLDITERKKAEVERENLIGQLNEAQGQQQLLSARLIEAQENERRVIARELHDEVGQALTALKINLQTVQRKHNNSLDLAESIAMVENTLQQVRTISLNLPPTVLEDLGLAPALRWLLDRQGREAGFSTSFISSLEEPRLNPQIEIACFRVAQEALTNVMRHAHARNVKVELAQVGQQLHLTIFDDGSGYDVKAAYQRARQGNSLGLVSIQERVLLAGGRMEIESASGKGTRIHAIFPLGQLNQPGGLQEKLP